MKKTIILFLVVLLTACSVNSVSPSNPSQIPASETPVPYTNTPIPPTFTYTPSPTFTITPTSPYNLAILNHEALNQVATALNFQIEEYQITLTAASDQIATLSAYQSTLIAAPPSSSSSSGGSSSSGAVVVDGYDIPANVNLVTIIDDAFLEITRRDNNAGRPIMQQVMPQIHLYPGSHSFVYNEPVIADGGGRYYLVYDPDGQSAEDYYFREQDIQIKLRNGTPNPYRYPLDVVKSRTIQNVVAYIIAGYDGNGKPIMEALDPVLRWGGGETILIHGTRVIATGNQLFFSVYDPDGQSSIYVVGSRLEMMTLWD